MSVVAGIGLFDGVLLVSDSRATWRGGSGLHHQDNLEKVLAIVPGTAIAFVGDVDFASEMLLAAFSDLRRRKQHDPFSLKLWLPRFFRFYYPKVASHFGRNPAVGFMIGSSVYGRPNVIARQDVRDLLAQMGSRPDGIGRGSDMLWRLASVETERIAISKTSQSLLYVVRSPKFNVEEYRPLRPVLLGSGADASDVTVSELKDRILFYNPFGRQRNASPSGYEVFWLRHALANSLKVPTVGGLFPAVMIRGKNVGPLWDRTQSASGQPLISLDYEDGRWIQRDHTTGQEITLLRPWELKKEPDAGPLLWRKPSMAPVL